MTEKKLPLLGDVRDESAEDIRLVLEPKSRTVDPVLLMESLFRLTELEVRFGLNMNVLSAGQIPNVLSLRDVLRQWLEHRIEVLVRRSQYRLKQDRASPGSARRLPDRLPQHRRGDPHRPLRGRAQGQADRRASS